MEASERDKLIAEGQQVVEGVFGHCLKKYQLYSYLAPDDLQDLKQECFLEMINVIDSGKYDPTKGKLSTFLSQRLHGVVKDYLKKEMQTRGVNGNMEAVAVKLEAFRRLTNTDIQVQVDSISNSEVKNLLFDMAQHPDAYDIVDAMLELPEHRREVIFGYYLLNKSIEELSEQKGISPTTGWVYRLKREGIEKLKEILKEKGIL